MDVKSTVEQGPQWQAAREAVREAKQARLVMKNYTQVVHQLPLLLQRHGLGQTLVYLRMRGGGNPASHFDLLARQLDRWLQESVDTSPRGALVTLAAKDSRFYREASEHVWLWVRALRASVEERQ